MKYINYSISQILILTILIVGCRFNSTHFNKEEDKNDAEIVTNQLYGHIKSGNFESTFPLFSKVFWEETTKQELQNMYSATNKKCGILINTEIVKWETKRVEGSNPFAEYVLVYNNTYENAEATELIKLIREDDGEIRIYNYRISSDAFVE